MPNAVIYLRISSDRTGDEAGVTRQREDCEKRCADRGWTVVAIEQDNDASARAGARKRPGFERVLSRIADGEAQMVVAWALDRIQRSRRDELRLYELCQEYDVTVSLVRGPDLEWRTPTGRYLADNLGALARMEIEIKSDRQKRAVRQAAAAGRRVGGRRPFGYEPDGMTVRPVEAAGVRAAYTSVLAGEPLAAIVRTFNDAGLATGQGNAWHSDTIRGLLTNPRYAGLRGHGSQPKQGRRKVEIVAQAQWPAIVSEETWRAVQAILSDPGRRTPPIGARALLTGVARCGVCGGAIVGGRPAGCDYRTLRCKPTPGHIARRAEDVEQYVSDVMVARLARPDAVELLVDRERPDLDALSEEAMALRARLVDAGAMFARGAITAVQLERITADLQASLTTVEGTMADAGRVNVLGPLVGAQDVRLVWDGMSVDRRRAVIDTLADVVVHPPGRGVRTFRPETVEITWKEA
jgi:DNA invertase Pin-like site-specific DNA recombinase